MDKLGDCEQVKLEGVERSEGISSQGLTAWMFTEVEQQLHPTETKCGWLVKVHPGLCATSAMAGQP